MKSLILSRNSAPIRRCSSGSSRAIRQGITLVEMLVALALSLIVILAVTQAFQMVGDNVMASRAVLEMSGQLRGVTNQLQTDLAGITVPVRPWPDSSSGLGYFEYHEGPVWDMGIGGMPHAESSTGDIDDVLLFTSRAVGRPFVGQISGYITGNVLVFDPNGPANAIESRVAEIAWFTRFNDANLNRQVDPGEVTLHRREFLVLPNLDLSHASVQAMTPGQFYNAFDISIHYQLNPQTSSWEKFANSLRDLTQRENRIAHNMAGGYPIDSSDPLVIRQPRPNDASIIRELPAGLSRALLVPQGTVVTPGDDGAAGLKGTNDDGNSLTDGSTSIDEAGEAGAFFCLNPVDPDVIRYIPTDDRVVPISDIFANNATLAYFGESYGNDVVLSHVLAFDVKAYDTQVVMHQSTDGTETLLPGDPGFDPTALMVGRGGYVDLFYARYLPGDQSAASNLSGLPHPKSGLRSPYIADLALHPAVYDTWSMFYEHDGVDQNGNAIIDEATNGLDDDGLNGVDDVGERETAPPYSVPLRGIQVRFRVIDNDTRQVRQVTVTSEFIPE